MQPIIYDVAVSLDGFISGPSGDISQFDHEGPVVTDYQARMAEYKIAIMGRTTYEFGFQYGLKPGQNPYPHMETIVFSKNLKCPDDRDITVQRSTKEHYIRQLKKRAKGPIYLCGGGDFAGWLLDKGLVDKLILKRAPCIYGHGVSLFGATPIAKRASRINTKTYDNGYLLEEFTIQTSNIT